MSYNTATNTYETFNDLRRTIGQTSSSIKCLGRDNVNDGYGGIFYYNSTSNASDDNEFVIQPIGVTTGRWLKLVIDLPPVSIPNLQSITDKGNSTTNPITISANPAPLGISQAPPGLNVYDNSLIAGGSGNQNLNYNTYGDGVHTFKKRGTFFGGPVADFQSGPVKGLPAENLDEFATLEQVEALGVFTGTIAQIRSLNTTLYSYTTFISTDFGPGEWYLDPSDTTSVDNTGTILVTANNKRIKRFYNKGQVVLSWFGALADWNGTTGTDCKNAFNAAIQFLLDNGGGELLVETGHYYMTPGVFVNTNSQIPISIKGFSDNLSYSDSDLNVKGTVIHMDTPGTHFFVGLNADGSRFYSNPNFLYKAFSIKNLSFIGENVTLGINVFQTFFNRTYTDNISATKVDYLILQEDTDSLSNSNYCDGSRYIGTKIYQSRKGGLKLNRCDSTIIETLIAETGTSTTENILDIKSASGVSISGFILGGNATTPDLIPGSSMISLNNCTNVTFTGLHVERPYFESVIHTFGNSRNINVTGIQTKFQTNYVFKFSGSVRTFHINNWFGSFSDGPNPTYTDIYAVNTSTDDIQINGLNLLMADNVTSRDYTISGAAINTTQSNTNNLLTTERINFPKAFNEVVRGFAYDKSQSALSGGGQVSYDASSNLKWTTRFLTPLADKILGASGFIEFAMPTVGTIISGLGTTPSVTVTSSGIPLTGGWNVLLGEHTTGSLGTVVTYKVAVFTTMGTNTLKPNQIIIAARNNDNGSLRLGTGHTMVPASLIINGKLIQKSTIQEIVNTDTTINLGVETVILNKGGQVNGVNRTLTLQTPSLITGQTITIFNYNSGAQSFISSATLINKDLTTLTTLPNQSVIDIQSDGTNYRIKNIY